MSLFSTALSGLNAAQYGLQTTSHNISNQSTVGYSRQQIVQTTNTALYTGSGYLGQGTTVTTVQRMYSQYLNSQLLSAQAGSAQMDAYQTQIQQIDNMMGDSTTGVSPALSDFFTAAQAVSSNPSDTSSRQSLLSSAQALVSQLQSVNTQLQQIRDGINSQINSEVGTINSYAGQIAQINQQIIQAQAAGSSAQPPNDLLDQRDTLIANLNKEIRATTVTQADGTFSVFIGNGEPLVLGTSSFTLQSVPSPIDADKTLVSVTSLNGGSMIIPESQLSGGTLGGLISFRSESLDGTQNGIGRIALAVAQDVNNILQSGQDLNGNLGSKLFNVPSPTVTASTLNTGTGTVGASIIDRNYRVVFGAAGAYTVYDAATNASLATGTAGAGATNIFVDGVKLVINNGNTAAAGDAFDINPSNAAGSRAVAESTNTSTASATGAALAFPVAIVTGVNDTFSVTLNGTTQTVTVAGAAAPGISYPNAGALAGAVQAALNAAFPAAGAGVTVTTSGNSLVLTSQQALTNASLVVGASAGATSMFGGALTASSATMDSSGSNIQALDTSDYQLDYVSNAGGNLTFRLTRLSDNSTWIGSGTTYQAAFDNLASQQQTGFTFSAPAAGTLSVGDSFGVQPTRYAAGTLSVAATDTSTIAAAAPFVASAASTNTGKAAISAGAVVNTGHLPLATTVTFTYNSTTKTLTTPPAAVLPGGPWDGLSVPYDPTTQTSATITVNGLSFTLSGTPANGDTFTLAANTNGVADNRTANLLTALQTGKTLAGTADSLTANATASFAAAYAQIVSQVGNTANQVSVTAKAQQTLADEAQTARDSLSGVNLDEEAANLIAFQQAYQASAKVLAVASKLFDQILAMGA